MLDAVKNQSATLLHHLNDNHGVISDSHGAISGGNGVSNDSNGVLVNGKFGGDLNLCMLVNGDKEDENGKTNNLKMHSKIANKNA